MIALGLDISLRATGVARINTDTGHTVVRTIKPGTRTGGARLDYILEEITPLMYDVDLALVEAPSMASKTNNRVEMYGVWGIVTHRLYQRRVAYGSCPPWNLECYVTGSGNAGKIATMREIQRTFPALTFDDDDQTDAMGLATMACRRRNQVVDAHRDRWVQELEKVAWPGPTGEPRRT